MERLAKGLYRFPRSDKSHNFKKEDAVQFWHDCDKYKDRKTARVELKRTDETNETITFECEHCGFVHVFDRIYPKSMKK